MIGIIDRLVLKEFIKYLFGSIIFFNGVGLMAKIIETLPIILSSNATMTDVFLLYLYYIPAMTTFIVLPSFLFAVTFLVSNFSHTKELTAIRAAGRSIKRFLIPILIFSLIFTFIFFTFNEKISFNATYLAEVKRNQIRGRGPDFHLMRLRSNLEIKSNNRFFHVGLFIPPEKKMLNVHIVDLYDNLNINRVIIAKEAHIQAGNWEFIDGVLILFDKDGYFISQQQFTKNNFDISESEKDFYINIRSPDVMTLEQLREAIAFSSKRGENCAEYNVFVYWHYSFPLMTFFFAIIGSMISIKLQGASLANSLTVCVFAGIIYFLIMYYGMALGNKDILPAIIAGWLPNIIFGLPALGLVFFFRD